MLSAKDLSIMSGIIQQYFLPDTCTVERKTTATKDAMGASSPSYASAATEACLYESTTGKLIPNIDRGDSTNTAKPLALSLQNFIFRADIAVIPVGSRITYNGRKYQVTFAPSISSYEVHYVVQVEEIK